MGILFGEESCLAKCCHYVRELVDVTEFRMMFVRLMRSLGNMGMFLFVIERCWCVDYCRGSQVGIHC